MVAKLVSGSTAKGQGAEATVSNLQNYVGDQVEVYHDGENFAGELVSVEERTVDGTVVGARFTVDKRKLGGEVTLSTFFKDDFDNGDWVKPF